MLQRYVGFLVGIHTRGEAMTSFGTALHAHGTGVELRVIGVKKLSVDYRHYAVKRPHVPRVRRVGRVLESHNPPSLPRNSKRVSLVSPAEQKQRTQTLAT